jgi:hypothetical protein
MVNQTEQHQWVCRESCHIIKNNIISIDQFVQKLFENLETNGINNIDRVLPMTCLAPSPKQLKTCSTNYHIIHLKKCDLVDREWYTSCL